MRPALTLLLALLSFAPQLTARTRHDWQNLEKLRPRTPAMIFLWSGETLSGRVEQVSDKELRLAAFDSLEPSQRREIDRASIRRVVRVRAHQPNLPDPHKWIVYGTVGGGAVGVVSGAIYDGVHGSNQAHWLSGGLVGASAGFLGSCAVLAGIGLVEATTLTFHRSAVVYEDPRSQALLHHRDIQNQQTPQATGNSE